MSKHPTGARLEWDAYYTPDDLAQDIVDVLPLSKGSRVLEPSAGGGAFVRALKARGCGVVAIDANPETPWRTVAFEDYATKGYCFDWVVGNPPFRAAQAHVEKALAIAPNVAFLLRMGFGNTKARRAFWEDPERGGRLAAVIMLGKRPSFYRDARRGRTDGTDYAVFLFTHYSEESEPVPVFSTLYPSARDDAGYRAAWKHPKGGQ